MAENYIDVTAENFAEKILQAPQLVVVNFSAEQSNACKIQDPEIEAISKEYQDRVTFARLNVGEHEELTRQWNVEGVPTLVFFKGGNEIYRIQGIVMRQRLRRQVEGVLLAN
jgi:thioredoxin 1